jgi:hypothetical protein
MKDTIKNSIIGAFAIFGLVALISSSNNAPTIVQENSNNIWEMSDEVLVNGNGYKSFFILNKATGEVRKYGTSGRKDSKLQCLRTAKITDPIKYKFDE